jgi:UDP-N-acetylglucosamine enolpyruvyl transferase
VTPLVEVVVGASAIVTAGAATTGATFAWRAYRNSAQALRLLRGEDGVEDQGIVERVNALENGYSELRERLIELGGQA